MPPVGKALESEGKKVVLNFSDDDEEEEKGTAPFKVNEQYARTYNDWKAKEQLQKLKDKYGNLSGSDLESSSESEDETAEGLTPEVEKDFFRTLAILKSKNPVIHDKTKKFFKDLDQEDEGDDDEEDNKKSSKKSKPMYLKDFERKMLLEKDGIPDEEGRPSRQFQTYHDEQQAIKEKLAALAKDSDEEEDLLKPRQKTEEERKKEEDDYVAWLKGQESPKNEEAKESLKPLKDFWTDPNLDDGEKFLRDYILERNYLEEGADRIPSYSEIVDEKFSDEEKELEKEEEFEHKYNFRFEEPDPDFIKRYPRSMTDTLRRKDDTRKQKRDEVKERKEAEKSRVKEELKQLKMLKKREILQKIEKLQAVAGAEELPVDEKDLEDDFDPEKYDQMMKKMFSDDYYGSKTDIEKPELSDESDVDENWAAEQEAIEEEEDDTTQPGTTSQKLSEKRNVKTEEVEDMDDDSAIVASTSQESGKKGKRKRRSKVSELLQRAKPVFNPDQQKLEEYLEEYYKLDFEDVVAGMPCRFKYRNVVPNNFGLTPEEILKARDKELNAWCSLKKAVQYRSEEEEKHDLHVFSQKGQSLQAKLRVMPSLAEEKNEEGTDLVDATSNGEAGEKKKRRRRKKKSGAANPGPEAVGTPLNATKTTKNSSESEPTKTEPVSPQKRDDQQKPETHGEIKPLEQKEESTAVEKKKKRRKKNRANPSVTDGASKEGNQADQSQKSAEGELTPATNGNKKRKRGKDAKDGKDASGEPKSKKQKTLQHQQFLKSLPSSRISDERLKAYGLNPKKFRQKEKYVLLAKQKEKPAK